MNPVLIEVLRHPKRINWALLVLKLRRHIPHTTLSRQLGQCCSWGTQIAAGKIREPKFLVGLALLEYAADRLTPQDWAVVCGVGASRREDIK